MFMLTCARGYLQALKDHKIVFEEELLIINDLSARSGAEAAEKILNMPGRPDGVFVANDICAISCMQTVKKAGVKIPARYCIREKGSITILRHVLSSLT